MWARCWSAISVKSRIRSIPDFPRQGIVPCGITTLLKNAKGLRLIMHKRVNRYGGKKINEVAMPALFIMQS